MPNLQKKNPSDLLYDHTCPRKNPKPYEETIQFMIKMFFQSAKQWGCHVNNNHDHREYDHIAKSIR